MAENRIEKGQIEARDGLHAPRLVKKLYFEAFPREERIPFPLLRLLAFRRGAAFTEYYLGNRFCGFTYTFEQGETAFLMFFAVTAETRGRGAGSEILRLLREKYGEKAVILDIEPPDPGAENAEQRLRRLSFYEKNGFFDTGFYLDEYCGRLKLLSSKRELDKESCRALLKRLSVGEWSFRLEEKREVY